MKRAERKTAGEFSSFSLFFDAEKAKR